MKTDEFLGLCIECEEPVLNGRGVYDLGMLYCAPCWAEDDDDDDDDDEFDWVQCECEFEESWECGYCNRDEDDDDDDDD